MIHPLIISTAFEIAFLPNFGEIIFNSRKLTNFSIISEAAKEVIDNLQVLPSLQKRVCGRTVVVRSKELLNEVSLKSRMSQKANIDRR